jgi:two-component sensor histidine kinase
MHLAEHIIDAYDAEKYVSFECHMEPIELDLDTAVPVGLIVNELITNALKYAFPNKQKGLIGIQLKPIANECLYLQVTDNGIGKTHSESVGNAGFGSHLILLLAKQLGGKIKEETKNGTKISLTFRWTNLHNE